MPGTLPIWTIFDHPLDFPDYYVARRFVAGAQGVSPDDEVYLNHDLEGIRAWMIGQGLTCVARDPADDEKIIESWL